MPAQSNVRERRRFQRVFYSVAAELHQDGESWPCELIDISLKGALVHCPQYRLSQQEGDKYLSFCLSESDIAIKMAVELAHQEGEKLGFYCHHTDINSATHLRRMVELNLGCEELLLRELTQLLLDNNESIAPL